MPDTAPRTRTAMLRRSTTYEVVATLPTGEIRLGFTSRPSRATFLRLARQHADAILPHIADDAPATYTTAGGLRLGAVTIRKSGRTEREIASEEAVS